MKKQPYQYGDYEPYERPGKLIIPRIIACLLVGAIGVFFIGAVFIKALEQAWIFIDKHPTYTGLTILALFSCYGIYWLVKYLKNN